MVATLTTALAHGGYIDYSPSPWWLPLALILTRVGTRACDPQWYELGLEEPPLLGLNLGQSWWSQGLNRPNAKPKPKPNPNPGPTANRVPAPSLLLLLPLCHTTYAANARNAVRDIDTITVFEGQPEP